MVSAPESAIEPVLVDGSPYVECFDVAVPLPAGGEQRRRFSTEFFRKLVRRVGAQLAVTGKIAPDAVLISHGHHDHCAALPYLLKMYPSVVPFATSATVAVLDRMLHNSVSVMEKMRLERGIEEYPLYTHDDVDFAVRRLYRGIPMNNEFAILPDNDLRVCFSHAGHVLGSACTRVSSPDHTVLYTGDVCLIDQELMSGMKFPKESRQVDTLIIESTYGANATAHGNPEPLSSKTGTHA